MKECVAASRTEELELITVSSWAGAKAVLEGRDLPFLIARLSTTLCYQILNIGNKITLPSRKNKAAVV